MKADRIQPAGSAKDTDRRVVSFEDNRLASEVFGQFDQNLALIEQRLGIDVVAHGNHVTLTGSQADCETAMEVLSGLEARAGSGQSVTLGDVDGALRLARTPVEAAAGDETVTTGKGGAAGVDGKPATIETRKRIVTARTPNQDLYMRALKAHELVFGIGPAGTGKTYLAVAHAAALLERGHVDRIILSRPAVEAGERLGFLPGDMKDKVDPYLRPLYDALYDVMAPDRVEKDIESGVIEIAPLAFMRGRTLANAAVILDEAQNTTSMQMKMFLTRLGENGRMMINGDPSQVDLPPGQVSGLNEAVSLLTNVEGIRVSRFDGSDVVRHPIVARIVAAYDGTTKASD